MKPDFSNMPDKTKNDEVKYTNACPTPWFWTTKREQGGVMIYMVGDIPGDSKFVASTMMPGKAFYSKRAEANAELIVRAVNAYEDLLTACKAVITAGLVPPASSLPRTTKTVIGDVSKLVYDAVAKAERDYGDFS